MKTVNKIMWFGIGKYPPLNKKKIQTNRDTREFKQIKALISAYIAYLEVLNN